MSLPGSTDRRAGVPAASSHEAHTNRFSQLVTELWLGGTLTNFRTVKQSVQRNSTWTESSSCTSQRMGCRYGESQLGHAVSLATAANVPAAPDGWA